MVVMCTVSQMHQFHCLQQLQPSKLRFLLTLWKGKTDSPVCKLSQFLVSPFSDILRTEFVLCCPGFKHMWVHKCMVTHTHNIFSDFLVCVIDFGALDDDEDLIWYTKYHNIWKESYVPSPDGDNKRSGRKPSRRELSQKKATLDNLGIPIVILTSGKIRGNIRTIKNNYLLTIYSKGI